MMLSPSERKKRALVLLRANRAGRSWRVIARDDFKGKVNHTTLNRFANSKGAWVPKDESILIAMDLIKKPNPMAVLPKWYKRTNEALEFFNGKRNAIKAMSKATRQCLKR